MKFNKLASLHKEILLLEQYGDHKSAEILHNKFVREAQLNMYNDPDLNMQIKQNRYQGYQTPGAPAGPAATSNEDYAGQNNAYTIATPSTNNATPAAQQQTSPVNSDTANQMQAQNTMTPNAEVVTYQTSIKQIADLLNTKDPQNRTKAQQIYDSTVPYLKDPKRLKAFSNQYQQIVSRNFPGQSPQPGSFNRLMLPKQ